MKYLTALLIVTMLGCACPQKIVLREGMYNGVRTERDFAKEVAAKLVLDPTTGKDNRAALQSLTPAQYQNLLKTDQEFEQLYQDDKSKDGFNAK